MDPQDTEVLFGVQEKSYERAGRGLRDAYPKSQSMDTGELGSFLHDRCYAVLATSRPDGRAHAAPIAFTVWKAAFWIASVEGVRARNLRVRPYAAIVVMEGEGPAHRAVIAEGPVTIHPTVGATHLPDELDRLWRERHGGSPMWATVLIELRPIRLFSHDATKAKA